MVSVGNRQLRRLTSTAADSLRCQVNGLIDGKPKRVGRSRGIHQNRWCANDGDGVFVIALFCASLLIRLNIRIHG